MRGRFYGRRATGRAKCAHCGEKIKKGEEAFGFHCHFGATTIDQQLHMRCIGRIMAGDMPTRVLPASMNF